MYLKSQADGDRVEVLIPFQDPFVVYVHPDGAQNFLDLTVNARLDDVQRAEKRLAKVNRQLRAGLIDGDEYEALKEEADANHKEALAKIQASYDSGELTQTQKDFQKKQVEAMYKEHCSDLLNQRDGKPPSPQESRQLIEEREEWEAQANIKPFAIPYLMDVLIRWEYWLNEEAKAHAEPCLPVSESLLESMSDSVIKLITIRVMGHYQEKVTEEKKSSVNGNGLTTPIGMEAVNRIGDSPTKLPESGESAQRKFLNGEPENFTVAQLP